MLAIASSGPILSCSMLNSSVGGTKTPKLYVTFGEIHFEKLQSVRSALLTSNQKTILRQVGAGELSQSLASVRAN
jgi:hypothetical protein